MTFHGSVHNVAMWSRMAIGAMLIGLLVAGCETDTEQQVETPSGDECEVGEVDCDGAWTVSCENGYWVRIENCGEKNLQCIAGECDFTSEGDGDGDWDLDDETDADKDEDSPSPADRDIDGAELDVEPDGDPSDGDLDEPEADEKPDSEMEWEADEETDEEWDRSDEELDEDAEADWIDHDSDGEEEADELDEGDGDHDLQGADEEEPLVCTGGPCCLEGGWLSPNEPCLWGQDDFDCTSDVCDEHHECIHVLGEGACLIEGTCFDENDVHPGNPCASCAPDVSPSAWTHVADGTRCSDDGNDCNGVDTCQAGSCERTVDPVSCAALNECHAIGICNPVTGLCSNPEKADGTRCSDDGNDCNGVDTCQSGSCERTLEPVSCAALDECHAIGVCNPATGVCSDPEQADGTACLDDELSCTVDQCLSGVCDHAALVADTCLIDGLCFAAGEPEPGNPCAQCDPSVAAWEWTSQADGVSCDDGDRCNGVDTCQSGSCERTLDPVSCAALDECHAIGVCNPVTGVCSNPEKADGTRCSDDGNDCNGVDTCQAGSCERTVDPVSCAALNECHAIGICNPVTGLCSNPEKADGTRCSDDGNDCNGVDTCQSGSCERTLEPVSCAALDECHAIGVCNPATGVCSDPEQADGTACLDDELSCTVDQCLSGVCDHAALVADTCLIDGLCFAAGEPEPGNPCAQCDPSVAAWEWTSQADGVSCDDGDRCNGVDTCQSGSCERTLDPVSCAALDECHAIGVCNPVTGVCSNPEKADGTRCSDDGNDCNGVDTCQAGSCERTVDPVSCAALNHDCATYACEPSTGACSIMTPINEGLACDDGMGSLCTSDVCENGACTHEASGVNCYINGVCHVYNDDNPGNFCEFCNPLVSRYAWSPKSASTTCNDGNLCTLTDRCNGQGACAGYDPKPCYALDECHVAGVCDPVTGACSNPTAQDGLGCTNDGQICTQDMCLGGVCTHSTPTSDGSACEGDGKSCTVDQCVGGVCNHDALLPDVCLIGGQCIPENTINPSNECQKCLPDMNAHGWSARPNGIDCTDDGNVCTVDQCVAGVCDHGTSAENGSACPADALSCTIDQCIGGVCNHDELKATACLIGGTCYDQEAQNPANECQSCLPVVVQNNWSDKPNGTICDAGELCSMNDYCDYGVCKRGDDALDGTACDDGVFCNGDDECSAGACATHAGNPCSSPDVCNEGVDLCTDCNSGVCCDSNGNFRGTSYVCRRDTDYYCDCRGSTAGNYIKKADRRRYCSGTSSSCTGIYNVDGGSWHTTFDCNYMCSEDGYDGNGYTNCRCTGGPY